jgi:hypothetical protein
VADLVNSVLGGARSLIVGWILPVFVSLQIINLLILPELSQTRFITKFAHQSSASQQLAFLAIAVVSGLVLAAIQSPLYRILEGYTLWPRKIADHRIKKHQSRKRRLDEEYNTVAQTNSGVRAGLIYERAARYPVKEEQFAPTMLGNAIRRFETYAGDRYQLDSQLLWHHLTAAAPDRAITSVDNARTNVDFFVCFLYGGALIAALGIGVTLSDARSTRSALAIVIGVLIAAICYQLAVIATDQWSAAVRALVDHGREQVAAAFGLTIPPSFDDERYMWRAVNTLVRRPYRYSETRDPSVPSVITRFRGKEDPEGAAGARSAPGTGLQPTPQHQQEPLARTALQIAGSACIALAVLVVRSRIRRGLGSNRG